ncbi:PREDICTED: uncharacterized protein LOC105559970 isoform X2 [Vollenhovia emeryi]|uniref:uncharacterized protein LOC105559970 isoform X2 n=1 Tax=Vollenhovia emeryi TaxID=411798 RepID=UPI0005F41536|nr:PREDICTED: uncharacterized protein LOC105559970 isoform X2 [Vollenhovia emeryi]
MTEIEKWMRKHYTQENPDTIRIRRISKALQHKGKLRNNVFNGNMQAFKGKRSLLWDKFDERGDYATCKECKKKLALNGKSPTTNLQQHLSRCRHLNLDHLNKDELTKIRRRSLVWDKYDVMGNKATCKRCTKKVFIRNLKNPLPNLRYHLYHCYYLNLDQASKDELKKIRRRSRIWDKYDVMDNKAACKECKKILKINGKTDSLKNHFLYCRRLNLGHISKAELKKKRRRSQVWENFDDVEGNMEIVICKHCKREVKLGLSASSRLAGHLRHCRRINLDEDELRKRRRRSQVWEKFDDEEGNMEIAICKQCKKAVKLGPSATSRLTAHLQYCRSKKEDMKNIAPTEQVQCDRQDDMQGM